MYKDYKLFQAHARDCLAEAKRARLIRVARQNLESPKLNTKNVSFLRRAVATIGTALMVFLGACGGSPTLGTTLEPQDFGTPQDDFGTSVAANSQGVFVAGWTKGSLDGINLGDFDAFVRRYDGGKLWGKQFGTNSFDTGDAIAVDSVGNSYLIGFTYGALVPNTQVGYSDVYVRKYNGNGVVQWTKQFGTPDFDTSKDVALDSAGNVFVLSSEGNNNFTLRKFSATGTLLLTKSVTDANKPSLTPVALAVDSANNVIVLTNWSNNTVSKGLDVRLYKYTNTLTPVWQKAYSTPNHDNAYDLTTDGSNLYFTLFLNGTGTGYGGRYVKMDSNGTLLFAKQLEPTTTSLSTTLSSITTDGAGNVYIAGYTGGAFTNFVSAGNDDIVVFKYNSAGTRQWVTQFGKDNYGSSGDDQAFGIAVSDAVYVTGYSRGNLLGQPKYNPGTDDDAFLAQVDFSGNIVGIDQ
jgi:Beta-propeller repeat